MNTDGVEERLATIQTGATQMAALALDRLRAAIEALLDGDFDAASDATQQALGKIMPLAVAQNTFTRLAQGATVIPTPGVEVGMTIIGWGFVTGVERVTPTDRGSAPAVKIMFTNPLGEEKVNVVGAEQEVIVFPVDAEIEPGAEG